MLGDRLQGRDNNFNLIRLMAAMAVLIGHCYPLAAALSLLFGIVSWHGVESPCLRLKRS